jgi:ribosomal protein S18 acetylase RimI-like enzyme
MSTASIRPATIDDSHTIARLFLISSDGLAEYIWSRIANPGEDLADVGARRYARTDVPFSYQNCAVAEVDGQVAGMIHRFPMEESPDGEKEEDPVLRPYSELEEYGSLYISGIALFPEFRGRGIGTRLIEEAAGQAKRRGLGKLSLICFDANTHAMRLYTRLGFEETERRPIVPHPTLHYAAGNAVLMVRAET